VIEDPNDDPWDGMWGGEPIPLSDEDDADGGVSLPFGTLAAPTSPWRPFIPRGVATPIHDMAGASAERYAPALIPVSIPGTV